MVSEVVAGQDYIIETSNLPAWTDTYLHLYGPDGQTQLAENDDISLGSNRASQLKWTAPAEGRYYLRIHDWNSGTAGDGVTYEVTVSLGGFKVFLPLLVKN